METFQMLHCCWTLGLHFLTTFTTRSILAFNLSSQIRYFAWCNDISMHQFMLDTCYIWFLVFEYVFVLSTELQTFISQWLFFSICLCSWMTKALFFRSRSRVIYLIMISFVNWSWNFWRDITDQSTMPWMVSTLQWIVSQSSW